MVQQLARVNSHFAITMAVALSIISIFRGEGSLLARIASAVTAAIAAGVAFLPIGALLTRRYPVRVYREGLRGYDERGGGLSATWAAMQRVVDSSSYGVRGYEVTIAGHDRTLWIPRAIAHDPRFVRSVREVLPQASHPLLRRIAPRAGRRT